MSKFVKLEIAKKLKAKGFREECIASYDIEDTVGIQYNMGVSVGFPLQVFDLLECKNNEEDGEVDAPTISQVLKWLRDEKEIDILPEVVISCIYDLYRIRSYSCKIYSPRLNKPIETDYFDSYEECIMSGIDYCLDNLL